jgi:hypothetical protein
VLLLGSSVSRKQGLMYREYRELFGNDDADPEDLCWFASSQVMNPRLPTHVIEKAIAKNPAKAKAEFLNQWRGDLDEFLPEDVIETCTDWGIHERAPQAGVQYFAKTDGAGGTGRDSYALAIGHNNADGSVTIDAIRERKPPFIPSQVVAEFAELLKAYGVTEVWADGYAKGYHHDVWSKHPVRLRDHESDTSDCYLKALPTFLAHRVYLIDNVVARNQLTSLERNVSARNKENVSHPKHAGAHDDVAAVVCGVIAVAQEQAALAAFRGPEAHSVFVGEVFNEIGEHFRSRY